MLQSEHRHFLHESFLAGSRSRWGVLFTHPFKDKQPVPRRTRYRPAAHVMLWSRRQRQCAGGDAARGKSGFGKAERSCQGKVRSRENCIVAHGMILCAKVCKHDRMAQKTSHFPVMLRQIFRHPFHLVFCGKWWSRRVLLFLEKNFPPFVTKIDDSVKLNCWGGDKQWMVTLLYHWAIWDECRVRSYFYRVVKLLPRGSTLKQTTKDRLRGTNSRLVPSYTARQNQLRCDCSDMPT